MEIGNTCRPRSRNSPDGKVRNLPGVRNIDLVQRDEPRPVFQTAVSFELRLDDIKIGNRIAARLIGGAVDHMDYRGAAFDVAQEVEAEPPPLTRSGDQPRNVSNGEADVAGDDDSQVGNKRGEGIVGDLGPEPGRWPRPVKTFQRSADPPTRYRRRPSTPG